MLEKQRTLIDSLDILIAAHALSLEVTLITIIIPILNIAKTKVVKVLI